MFRIVVVVERQALQRRFTGLGPLPNNAISALPAYRRTPGTAHGEPSRRQIAGSMPSASSRERQSARKCPATGISSERGYHDRYQQQDHNDEQACGQRVLSGRPAL